MRLAANSSLVRLAAAVLVIGIALVALWQAGVILQPAAVSVASCSGGAQPAPADASVDTATPGGLTVGLNAGNVAPDFEVSSLDCKRLRLSGFRGQPVLLNFWATWCVPCKQELPLIQQTLNAHTADNLAVIAVDSAESYTSESRFVQKLGIALTVFGYDPRGEVYTRYQLLGLPTSFFIDARGVITQVVRGALNESQISDGVAGAISGHVSSD
ncbi:MAG TPA: TlpA disulfide reductase family protein [Dehalococcoidia bacterium]|nr:TlpA disulfide reductase family protein [Dehalococcoidia bacterium]